MIYPKSAQRAQQIQSFFATVQNQDDLPALIGMASAEHIAHTVAYEIEKNQGEADIICSYDVNGSPLESTFVICMPKPEPITVYDDDGMIRLYNIKSIRCAHKGLVGYVLTGIDSANSKIHVVFRGTKDAHSLQRDLEQLAPGHNSYFDNSAQVIATIIEAINTLENKSQKLQLYISGHSLGGADAQNCATNIFKAISQNYDQLESERNTAMTRIDSININHVNSAGVTMTVDYEARMYAELLAQSYNISIHMRAIRVGGDFVQKVGQTNILSNIEPGFAQTELLKINSGHEGWISPRNVLIATTVSYLSPYAAPVLFGAFLGFSIRAAKKAHTERHFEQPKKLDYSLYNNATDDGREVIQKKLSNQVNIDGYEFIKYTRNWLYEIITRRNSAARDENLAEEPWIHIYHESIEPDDAARLELNP